MNRPVAHHRLADRCRAALRDSGMRLTPQRNAVLALFEGIEGHWTAQQIYSQFEKDGKTLSLATVYNTLELFVSLGLLRPFTTPDGVTVFDRNVAPHHHAVCDDCGTLLDIASTEGLSLITDAARAVAGFETVTANVWLHGVCANCG